MVRLNLAVSILVIIVTASAASADLAHGRVDGTLGGGEANLNSVSPSPDFRLNPGSFFTLQAEKPFGATSLYLVGAINYIRATGQDNYHYLSPTNINYTQNNVNFTLDEFQANLGLVYKFFDSGNIRPYLGGGGEGGFMQITYDNSLRTGPILDAGNDFAMIDNAIDLGFFGEVGTEVQLTQEIGVRLAFRYMDSFSRPFATLNNQIVHYEAAIYYGGLILGF